jgi:dGTPase
MWTQRRSGLTNQRGLQDHRDPYERDRTRVIHCPAFRRLQRKTQILGTDDGDFHRTRLTHSLEVDSIGKSIVRNLRNSSAEHILASLLPNDDLISVICLLHDIGHPPFGHGGEVALNYMMRDHGGFESNGQTLRLLTKTESSYGPFGLDLTRRALLGILKYPAPRSQLAAPLAPPAQSSAQKTLCINDWLPPKAYFDCEQPEVDWLLSPLSIADRERFQSLSFKPQAEQAGQTAYYSFDCSIMDIADDIAYGVHDLEDAIHLRLINPNHLDTQEFRQLLQETDLSNRQEQLIDSLFSENRALRKQAIGEMVHYFITSVAISIADAAFENPILKYNVVLQSDAAALLNYLKQSIYNYVINSQEARTLEYGGQTVLIKLFDAIHSNPGSLLDKSHRELFQRAKDDTEVYRVICDYLAHMSDEYAHRMHERLFGFNRTMFERL